MVGLGISVWEDDEEGKLEKDSDGKEIPRGYKSLIPWNLEGKAEQEMEVKKGKGKGKKRLNKDRLSSREKGKRLRGEEKFGRGVGGEGSPPTPIPRLPEHPTFLAPLARRWLGDRHPFRAG